MKFAIILLIFCTSSVLSQSEDEEEYRKETVKQLKKTKTIIREGYRFVSRQVGIVVHKYRNYGTVSGSVYDIPASTDEAIITFQAEELHMNGIGTCSPRKVVVHLKHGSYPAVNPDLYDFPKNFITEEERQIDAFHFSFLSDGDNISLVIPNPRYGFWYALMHLEWEDPRTQKVAQQGLVAVCKTVVYTDLQIKENKRIIEADCAHPLIVYYNSLPNIFICQFRESSETRKFEISIISPPPTKQFIIVRIQAEMFPEENDHMFECAFDANSNHVLNVTFFPHFYLWHFVTLEHAGNTTNITECHTYMGEIVADGSNVTIMSLMRDNQGRFFTFAYGIPTADLYDSTSVINMTSDEIISYKYPVVSSTDIGGTLVIEGSLLMPLKYFMGYKRKIENSMLAFTEENQYMKVVVCLDLNHFSIPLANGECKYNNVKKPALFVLNTTDSETIHRRIFIPYPESSVWYLTFRLFCDSVVCPCPASDNGTHYYVKTNRSVVNKGSLWRHGATFCNMSLILAVESSSCVGGKCQNYGSCLLNTNNGMVMSYCSCEAGYGGWDCSDASRKDSHGSMLLSVLLLTLSNLLFFVSIYIALIRLYYVEALMYASTMIFSTFYHACDAHTQVAYCILQRSVLQFGDFYAGLMCFWVTLLAVAVINISFRTTLQLAGAISIALLTTWNMHSFLSFLLPVMTGILIVFISWYYSYFRLRKLVYNRKYYTRYLPLGLILVTIGLICYAFLQTEQNYKIVHSVWHMLIALSIIFILPDANRKEAVNSFKPTSNCFRFPFFRRTPTDNLRTE